MPVRRPVEAAAVGVGACSEPILNLILVPVSAFG
jgi:hypothetical protein